jgi:hypothetical protein
MEIKYLVLGMRPIIAHTSKQPEREFTKKI